MKVYTVNGQEYRLPSTLSRFQQELYVHLINWKWAHITRDPGLSGGIAYDAILPDEYAGEHPVLYPAIHDAVKKHHEKLPFRFHLFFNHMASSQAANLNLFLPILFHPRSSAVFAEIKPDFARLASSQLDQGFRIEFWDEPYGNLGDKSETTGTDTDLAIAYYNHQGELCLWLIEHKLTEREFTTCGGFKSRGRQACHDCSQSFSAILADKHLCYYHDVRHFKYWNVTEVNQAFFANRALYRQCPFQGGLNQLWRNQLLGLSIEQDERQPYKHVTFSVVKHPRNTALDPSLAEYQGLIANNPKFSVFTSNNVLDAATRLNDPELNKWTAWYRELYAL